MNNPPLFAPIFDVCVFMVENRFVISIDVPITAFVLVAGTGDNKVKINFGSFINMSYHGWINSDIIDLNQFASQHRYKFLQLDVRQVLPFKEECVDLIFSSHMLEHLTKNEGLFFLRECYRVMKPGAVMRIVVPDAQRLINYYQEKQMTPA